MYLRKFFRIFARVNKNLRITFLLVFFLGGQIFGELDLELRFLPYLFIIGAIYIFINIYWKNYGIYKSNQIFFCLFLIFSFGYISTFCNYLVNKELSNNSPKSNETYLISIENLRQRKNEELEISANILKTYHPIKNENIFELVNSNLKSKILCKTGLLPWKNSNKIDVGDLIFLKANFKRIERKSNIFAYNNNLLRNQYLYTCKSIFLSKSITNNKTYFQKVREDFILKFENKFGSNEVTGFFLGLSFGFHDKISSDLENQFKKFGLAHLLVLSGYQISLIFITLKKFIKFLVGFISPLEFKFSLRKLVDVISLTISLFFVSFIGIENSSLRASLSILILVLLTHTKGQSKQIHQLLVSLLIISIIKPNCILEPGIQFTYISLFGIFYHSKNSFNMINISNKKLCYRIWLKLYSIFKITFFISLYNSILSYFWFGTYSYLGLILNFLLAPPLSILGCLIGIPASLLFYFGIDWEGYVVGLVLRILEIFLDYI